MKQRIGIPKQIFLFAASFCLTGLSTALAAPVYLPYQAKVIQVFDGKTIRLETGQRVELKAITVVSGKEAEAKKTLNDLVFQKIVYLNYSPKTPDRFGRVYAYVFLEDNQTMVNRVLVDKGLAAVSEVPADPYLKSKLIGTPQEEAPASGYDEFGDEFLLKEMEKQRTRQIFLLFGSMLLAVVLGVILRKFLIR